MPRIRELKTSREGAPAARGFEQMRKERDELCEYVSRIQSNYQREEDQLRRELDELKAANANCISLSLHESRMQSALAEVEHWRKKYGAQVDRFCEENAEVLRLRRELDSLKNQGEK